MTGASTVVLSDALFIDDDNASLTNVDFDPVVDQVRTLLGTSDVRLNPDTGQKAGTALKVIGGGDIS